MNWLYLSRVYCSTIDQFIMRYQSWKRWWNDFLIARHTPCHGRYGYNDGRHYICRLGLITCILCLCFVITLYYRQASCNSEIWFGRYLPRGLVWHLSKSFLNLYKFDSKITLESIPGSRTSFLLFHNGFNTIVHLKTEQHFCHLNCFNWQYTCKRFSHPGLLWLQSDNDL